MKSFYCLIATMFALGLTVACIDEKETSDMKLQKQQEVLLTQAADQIGMPGIVNFQEKKLLKYILELRDQANLTTFTYVYSDYTGKFTYIGRSVGFGIPYATQYTSPMKAERAWRRSVNSDGIGGESTTEVLPQADPGGLFSPESANGTWLLLVNPANPKEVKPIYMEPNICVLPFPLPGNVVINAPTSY